VTIETSAADSPPPPPKNIVLCCDGTWNTPDQQHGTAATPTNVAKLALGVVSDQVGQVMFYEPGVGASPDERVLGGAFGLGLSHNIRNAYRFLAESYNDGDRIFLFGFSRGAYTARSLAGLIHNCGILRCEHKDRVDQAFAFYRDRSDQAHPSTLAAEIFRREYAHADDTIHFIGVWDTVGALGIPDSLPGWEEFGRRVVDWQELWGFHDTSLGPHVRFAYHALSIDEKRPPFKPTLWSAVNPEAKEQTLLQTWFAGVHSEVGGGAQDSSLSDIALLWMVGHAKAAGLLVTDNRLRIGDDNGAGEKIAPNYAAPIADSLKGFWKGLHPYDRLEELRRPDEAPAGIQAPDQMLSPSAKHRFNEHIDGYSPRGFGDYFANLPTEPEQPADA
jgi:uncharacterized protein (DUF2235 family)